MMNKDNKVPEKQELQMNRNNEANQNIQLTVTRPASDRQELNIDLFEIGHGLTRYLALWLALAIAVAAIFGGAGLFLRRNQYGGNATALIEFSLADETMQADVNRLQTAAVVEQAMKNLDLDMAKLDAVREGLQITSVMSRETYDQMTLYYKAASEKGNIQAMDTVLSTGAQAARYRITLDYRRTGLKRTQAVQLLNEILLCYREDFEQQHNQHALLGNSVMAVDATAYGFSDAISIFQRELKTMKTYLQSSIVFQVLGTDIPAGSSYKEQLELIKGRLVTAFRSPTSGYTLQDLLDKTELLESTDMSTIAAYILMNSVTSREIDAELAHYDWLIQEKKQELATLQEKYDALEQSVETYKKDPVIYSATAATQTAAVDPVTGEATEVKKELDAYDTMIQEMVNLEEEIVSCNTAIRSYESASAKLSLNGSQVRENVEKARSMLTALAGKMTALNRAVNTTAEEYQAGAVKANAVNILVTASAREPGLMEGGWVRILIIAEFLMLLCWLVAGVVWGIRKANPRKKEATA